MSIIKPDFGQGVRDVAPFLLGALPFGLIAGVAAVDVGYSAGLAIANSTLVLAGTSQLAAFQLLKIGATVLTIWITTIFVNIRMMMYSLTLAPHFRRLSRSWRMLLAFMLTDQAFAFSLLRFQHEPELTLERKTSYYLGIATPVTVVWIGATAAGALLGARIPESWSLDFAIPLAFLALIIPHIKDHATAAAGSLAAALAVILIDLPFNLGLIAAILAGMAAGRLLEPATRSEEVGL